MKRDPLVFGALVAVLVVLASAEYQLARACGFGTYVAAGVPAALDIYAIKALRVRRDVAAVVVALVAVNAASHLVASGILPVDWPLIVAVSAIAPLVLWRVHRLSEEPVVGEKPTVAEGWVLVPTPGGDQQEHAGASPPAGPATAARYGDPVVAPRRPEVVPAGADLLPLVARGTTTTVTLERLDQQPEPAVTRPAVVDTWHAVDWSQIGASVTAENAANTTIVKAAEEARKVVTVPVTITPAELRKHARKINRKAVSDTGRPVTIAALMEKLSLSRRDATELRRHVVEGGRS